MATVINYKQLEGQTITATNDRIMYDTLALGNGVLYGCEMNFISLNNVHIDAGYILIMGGLVEIEEGDIQCELPSAAGIGRIYVRINLSDVDNTIQLKTIATTGDLPPLVEDENFNFDNGIYEYELGTYTANNVSVLTVTNTFKMLNKTSVAEIKRVIKQFENGILDSMEEIEANTEPNRIAGALAVKQLNASLSTRYNSSTDYIEVFGNGKWNNWLKVGILFDGIICSPDRLTSEYYGGTANGVIIVNSLYGVSATASTTASSSTGNASSSTYLLKPLSGKTLKGWKKINIVIGSFINTTGTISSQSATATFTLYDTTTNVALFSGNADGVVHEINLLDIDENHNYQIRLNVTAYVYSGKFASVTSNAYINSIILSND